MNLIDDVDREGGEGYTLVLSAPTGGAHLAASEVNTTIGSEDGPGELHLIFASDPIGVDEAAGTVHARVARVGGSEGAITVEFATAAAGNATPDADFIPATGTLSWADGDGSPKVIDIDVLDDALFEGTESFRINIANPTGGATIDLSADSQVVVILDDEAGVHFAATSASVSESGGSVTLAVSRSGSPAGAASVDYTTSPGSATEGSDFTGASGTLNWADGEVGDKTISIDVTNDTEDESNEDLTVLLSNPSGTALGASEATVVITDDDTPPPGDGGDGGGGGALDWVALAFLLFATVASKHIRKLPGGHPLKRPMRFKNHSARLPDHGR